MLFVVGYRCSILKICYKCWMLEFRACNKCIESDDELFKSSPHDESSCDSPVDESSCGSVRFNRFINDLQRKAKFYLGFSN